MGDVEEINVVCGRRVPARVKAFIDFLFDEVDLEDPPETGQGGEAWPATRGVRSRTSQ
jgi:hypothetical protein